ncbi:MAG: riboflavin synthase [Bacteroidales bacterium]
MFTGIIEEIGIIESVKRGESSAAITVRAKAVLRDIKPGDSINTNGACLTVTNFQQDKFTVDIMAETLRRTNLNDLKKGTRVNLERALSANGRLGGHFVSGHIDGPGIITNKKKEDIATWFTIKTTEEIIKYIVIKGSVAIDGISLTVADVDNDSFKVSIIPHTGSETTLLEKNIGDVLNIETDMIGKYIERFLQLGNNKVKETKIDMDFLSKHGFTF